ncbi:MAG: hypothetical protein LBK18_09485 [Prevotellaceae bacterium]|jgi:hypothetical protein|nr:hypothetical protein [Prevotellaceae bacterium]
MEAIALEAQKAELARKVLNLSDERIVNRLAAFFTQATASAKKEQSPLYHEIDAGLSELREVLNGQKQAKPFQQFLDEI